VNERARKGSALDVSEALAPFGVRVTALAPGSFRTDWAGRSMVCAPRRIADYNAVFNPIRKARQEKNGRQNGDPERLAQVLLRVVAMDDLAGSPAPGKRRIGPCRTGPEGSP
jgi:NAD(P)-dependent dehydrogenase (short-subunit alcohol dehydrogenase family)